MSLRPQSGKDTIQKVIMAKAFSCNTFRKTHKDPLPHSPEYGNFFGSWWKFFFSHGNKKEISNQLVTSAFEKITGGGGGGGGGERVNWLSPPKIINTAYQSNVWFMTGMIRSFRPPSMPIPIAADKMNKCLLLCAWRYVLDQNIHKSLRSWAILLALSYSFLLSWKHY